MLLCMVWYPASILNRGAVGRLCQPVESFLMATMPKYQKLEKKIKKLEIEIQRRIQAEEALKGREEKYKLVFENANDAIFIAQDGVIKFANRKKTEALGYSKKELQKIPATEFIYPDDKDSVVDNHLRRLKTAKVPSTDTFRMVNKAGKALWVEINTVPVIWQEKPATLNFVRNINEKKKLDAKLQYADKMVAIGTLAGGVAHTFNNLLMSIQGNTSLLLYDIDSTHPHYEGLKRIENEVQNGANLTSQLIGYARKGRYAVKLININHVIENTSMTFSETGKEIKVHRELEKNLHGIEANQGQMEQMLFNFYINAADAMPDGGNLILTTANVSHKEIKGKYYDPKPGNYVRLTVTDTGIGMDKKTQERIFDPFFTTKEMGRGTGLGLASVYGIIKNHDGYINVESKEGQGTVFYIYLPASDQKI